MTDQAARTEHFLSLHRGPEPLLLPNAWDRGSAVLLASLGFAAIATTSSGFAATLGRLDGNVTRDEALGHAAFIAASTGLPVSADLENCFADDPAGVAETVRLGDRDRAGRLLAAPRSPAEVLKACASGPLGDDVRSESAAAILTAQPDGTRDRSSALGRRWLNVGGR